MALITINVKQSVLIKLPIEEIFAYIRDLENLNDWSNVVVSVKKISTGVEDDGARVRGTIRFLGKWSEMTLEIVECRKNEYLTVKSTSGTAPCLFCYQLEPGEDGGTLLMQEATIHYMESRTALGEPVITGAVHRQLAYDLLTLRDILEAKALALQNG